MCQSCGGSTTATTDSTTPLAAESVADRPLVATIQPGFEAKVNYRLLPAREISVEPEDPGCQPRGSRPHRPVLPTSLTPELVAKLQEANKAVVAWLAKDAAHPGLFLADPVAALGQAGVDLSRAELKTLSRSHAAVRAEAVLPPGAVVSALTVSSDRRGKVGDGSSDRPAPPSPPSPTDTNC